MINYVMVCRCQVFVFHILTADCTWHFWKVLLAEGQRCAQVQFLRLICCWPPLNDVVQMMNYGHWVAHRDLQNQSWNYKRSLVLSILNHGTLQATYLEVRPLLEWVAVEVFVWEGLVELPGLCFGVFFAPGVPWVLLATLEASVVIGALVTLASCALVWKSKQ